MNSMASITKQGSQTPIITAVQGDQNTKAFTFVVQRFDGDVDLAELVWMLQVKNALGMTDATALYTYRTEDTVHLTWTIGGFATEAEGRTSLQLMAFDEEENMQWSSGTYYMEVSRRIAPDSSQRAATAQLKELVNAAVNTAGEATRRANEAADSIQDDLNTLAGKMPQVVNPYAEYQLLDKDDIDPTLTMHGKVADAGAVGAALQTQGGGGAAAVRCWGDSLTFGAGGNIDGWHVVDYPAEVAKVALCTNLGVPGEDTVTIMSRQGADPMVARAGLTIPAGCVPVMLADTGAGVPTRGGNRAYPLRQASAGVNPVMIAGVLGDMTVESTDSGTASTRYYFTRREAGAAITLAADMDIETLAMREMKGGIACIWMGANGGWSGDIGTLMSQIEGMVAYGQYSDYLVLTCRELNDDQLAAMADKFGDRLVDLKAYLNQRGLMDAGIITTDTTKKNGIPQQLDSGDGLHLNYYGYKAIGQYVAECLVHRGLLKAAAGVGGGTGSGGGTAGGEVVTRPVQDEYGSMLYRLPEPFEGNGTYKAINTGVKLFAESLPQWTLAITFKPDAMSCPMGYPATVAYCINHEKTYENFEGFCIRRTADTEWYDITGGNGTINTNADYIKDAVTPESGYDTLVVRRDGDRYSFMRNGAIAWGNWLTYPLNHGAFEDPLRLGVNVTAEGALSNYTECSIYDVRLYAMSLDDESALALCEEMMDDAAAAE